MAICQDYFFTARKTTIELCLAKCLCTVCRSLSSSR
jgi:hypothetical protein